tara:strand:- start:238 stop:357 length:120 start_codon:yes stop_codon:yes gene_type:complete
MYKFILGFISGVYVGSKYDMKPFINKIEGFVNNNFPKKD